MAWASARRSAATVGPERRCLDAHDRAHFGACADTASREHDDGNVASGAWSRAGLDGHHLRVERRPLRARFDLADDTHRHRLGTGIDQGVTNLLARGCREHDSGCRGPRTARCEHRDDQRRARPTARAAGTAQRDDGSESNRCTNRRNDRRASEQRDARGRPGETGDRNEAIGTHLTP
ncbi:MAG: hypothetical protein ABT08_10265 [Microbacterium sp. SCN 71-21]|nr:MAG: hypothetical protein ABT08_10265 [Microbacterium sp. SCN 71-21]